MPSSTSSSERTRRRNPHLEHAVLFAGTFFVLCGVTLAVWNAIPRAMPPERPADCYRAASPEGSGYDHLVLYHGQYGTAEAMKQADVLLLGNSRMMFAFPPEPTRRGFAKLGLRFYALGFGHIEADRFSLDIICKFDLRPKFAIINADSTYFLNRYSEFAEKKVVSLSLFDVAKQVFEEEAADRTERGLLRFLPHYLGRDAATRDSILRSRLDGTWLVRLGPSALYEVPEKVDAPPPSAAQLRHATEIKHELDRRGIQMMLMLAPSSHESREPAEHIARRLRVPLIAPTLKGLKTIDHSHLDGPSAARFNEAFFAELDAVLSRDGSHPLAMRGDVR